MVKFGKKFFFSELPEVEEKKPKKVKTKKENKPKKIKKPRKKINIKEKLNSIIEIIISVLRKIWPILALIIIIMLLALGIHACSKNAKKKTNNNTSKQQEVKPNIVNEIKISIYDEVPSIDKFVSNIEKFQNTENSIVYNNEKLIDNHYEEVGEYEVEININGKSYKSKLIVVDNLQPELELKAVTLTEGQTYSINDFINKCEDNSKKECIIKYSEDKYESITSPGTYNIKITATDINNNSVEKTTLLTINKKAETQPVPTPTPTPTPSNTCKYGDATYDKSTLLSYSVIKNNCAIDRTLAKENTYNEKPNNMAKNENQKLIKELPKLGLNIKISMEYFVREVPNTSGKGFVGYTIIFKLYNNNTNELLADYTLKPDGSRSFRTNKIGL